MEPLNESSGDDLFGDMDLEFSDAIQQKQQQEETTPSAPPLSNVSQLEDLDLTPQSCDGFAGLFILLNNDAQQFAFNFFSNFYCCCFVIFLSMRVRVNHVITRGFQS